jgi:peroxiredoxin
MPRILKLLGLSYLLTIAVLAEVPKVGDRAPQFDLPSTKGTKIALKDYIGKTKVVLVFYRGYW